MLFELKRIMRQIVWGKLITPSQSQLNTSCLFGHSQPFPLTHICLMQFIWAIYHEDQFIREILALLLAAHMLNINALALQLWLWPGIVLIAAHSAHAVWETGWWDFKCRWGNCFFACIQGVMCCLHRETTIVRISFSRQLDKKKTVEKKSLLKMSFLHFMDMGN